MIGSITANPSLYRLIEFMYISCFMCFINLTKMQASMTLK